MMFECCNSVSDSEFQKFKYEAYVLVSINNSQVNETELRYKKFYSDLNDPISAYGLKRFKPAIDEIQILSKSINKLIDSISHILDVDLIKSNKSLYKKNLVKEIFSDKNISSRLFHEINSYEYEVFSKDSVLPLTFPDLKILSAGIKSDTLSESGFSNIFFEGKSLIAAYINLLFLKNKISHFEGEIIKFYSFRYTNHEPYYDAFSVIVGQSSNSIRSGEELTITAGVGLFSTKANPVFVINADSVKMDPSGTATKIIKAPNVKGKYKVPVYIKFTKKDSTIEEKKVQVSYEVVN